MDDYLITAIQQIGIGVKDADQAWDWYRKHLGFDLPIFSDEAEASLMFNYTGGNVHRRNAILAMNVQGGGGFEIWQFTSREPKAAAFEIQEGLLGITSIHLRCKSVNLAHEYFDQLKEVSIQPIEKDAIGRSFFNMKDPFGNAFKIIEDDYQLLKTDYVVGGIIGLTIGVSNLEKSIHFYKEVLHFDQVSEHFKTGDIAKVYLKSSEQRKGTFSKLLARNCIELVENPSLNKRHTYENRYWGDLGFIHVCFDVQQMDSLREKAKVVDYPFKVDSDNSFNMGEAAGQFAYIEDPDKTLIELVETHKIPINKKMGLYLNLKNKKTRKPLAKWMIKLLALNRVKN
ncbi:MAG: VOC family protein [Flavobacteriales bacterium]|nr:VOC family protein [Flavobacteriales bacterium]